MLQPRLPEHRTARSGFTLVELLVAITIFAILSTIAVSAYRGLTDSDRLRNGSQQIQSAINGARSRALKDKLPRGVRFRMNSGVIDSLIYIGSMPDFVGNSKTNLSLIAVNDSNGYYNGRRLVAPKNSMLEAELRAAYDAGAFHDLSEIPAEVRVLRIQLPRGDQWYRIKNILREDPAPVFPFLNQDHANDPNYQFFSIRLAEPYSLASSISHSYTRLRLEVGPTPLPGIDPIPLPRNVAIPRAYDFGSGLQSLIPGAAANFRNIDVLFGPGGIPIGQNSAGTLRFLLADRRDIDTEALFQGQAKYGQRVVTYLSATGQTYVSEAGPTSNYFQYAEKGQEDKQ